MAKNTIKRYFAFLLVISTLLGAIGQLVFKIGVADVSDFSILVPYVILGFVIYAISTLIYFYTLSRTNLSWAYSFGGLSYLFTVIFAAAFLGEVIVPLRWLGVIVIVAGVALIGLS